MSRVRTAVAVAIAISVVGLVGCGREQPTVTGTTTIDVAERESLPAIFGTTLDGTSIDLADLRGKVVILNSWASWCEPCRTEIPAFVTLAGSVNPADVAIVGLNVSDDDAAARQFAAEFAMTYPSIVDGEGAILPTIPGVPPAALPSTVIIDRQGRIAVRIIGEVDANRLPALVTQVAAEKQPA